MADPITAGITLRALAPPYHLYIVLNEPRSSHGNQVVLVNFTDARSIEDNTVVILPDEGIHPFIQKPTAVYYNKARIVSIEALQRGVSGHVLAIQEPLLGEALVRVQRGLLTSPYTRFHIKEQYLSFTE
jgi:hypothetical protein